MKKILAVLLVVMVTVMTCAASVSAAAKEDDIVTALKTAGVADAYIAQAESYMAQDGVDLTEAQITGIVADINAANSVKAGQTDYSKLSSAQKTDIMNDVAHAASLLGLTSGMTDAHTFTIYDKTGKAILSADAAGAVKKTGFDYTIVFVGLAVIALAGVSAVAAKKVIRRREMELAAECR